jgi:PHD/YefM family antitoxin component YafN of YafNO toxin-antitoxin module
VSVSKAQSGLPKLCRDKRAILITTHEKPVSVLLPIEDYEALIETMDLLANPTAMRTLRAAKAGKLRYRRLNLNDEDFGLWSSGQMVEQFATRIEATSARCA